MSLNSGLILERYFPAFHVFSMRDEIEDYKTSKEAFVAGATGSSITHVNLVSAAALVRILVTAFLIPTNIREWVVLVGIVSKC